MSSIISYTNVVCLTWWNAFVVHFYFSQHVTLKKFKSMEQLQKEHHTDLYTLCLESAFVNILIYLPYLSYMCTFAFWLLHTRH